MALQDTLERGSREYPERKALLFEEESWSYAKVDAITDRIATNLIAQGLRRGDRVALLFVNCPEIVFGYYACFKAGLIAVPLNIRMKGAELAYVLNHSGARALLGQADLFHELEPVRADLPKLEVCFLTGDRSGLTKVREFVELRKSTVGPVDLPTVNAEEIVAILYTSGTTARPKGVMHSHYGLEQMIEAYRGLEFDTTSAVNAVVPSLAHMGSFAGSLLMTFKGGGTLLLFPKFDPVALLSGIEKHRVASFWLLPVLYGMLLQTPNASSYDLSSLKVCIAAGDTLPEPTRARFRETFGHEIVESCAMTEMAYCCNPIGEGNRPGSIGKPLPGVRIRLVNAAGDEVPVGETGEVLAQGEGMMCGYWQDPEATGEALRDGWMRTGDLVRQDADGYFWFVGRKRDIIVRGGSNIAPAEVEDALQSHPSILAVGVVGVPDAFWGEAVWAFVTLKPGESAAEATLRAYLESRIAAYKIPDIIRIVPSLPIGLTGKIHRQTLREWATVA